MHTASSAANTGSSVPTADVPSEMCVPLETTQQEHHNEKQVSMQKTQLSPPREGERVYPRTKFE